MFLKRIQENRKEQKIIILCFPLDTELCLLDHLKNIADLNKLKYELKCSNRKNKMAHKHFDFDHMFPSLL